jgi:hypothetical protein
MAGDHNVDVGVVVPGKVVRESYLINKLTDFMSKFAPKPLALNTKSPEAKSGAGIVEMLGSISPTLNLVVLDTTADDLKISNFAEL